MMDFSKEEDQKVFAIGPVPEGSMVMLRSEVLVSRNPAPDNNFVHVSENTQIRGLNITFHVASGQFEGVRFSEFVTLPVEAQTINLTDNQRTACRIGGAKIKAMLQAARKPLQVNSVEELHNLRFPAKLGLKKEPHIKDGREYWNNRILAVVTPDKKEYAQLMSGREIITDGAITGVKPVSSASSSTVSAGASYSTSSGSAPFPSEASGMDDVPF